MRLIISGLVVHLVFLASIFDVYFNSPVIQGIEVHTPSFAPAADRLVLFVADGLRARTFFSNHTNASPHLRNILENRGSWGVSHTRVPTESRPGHVAMIAGLYEDPSAVTKGWEENPVEFDSVFNRSRHTWAWGSLDILPMFAKGEASGRVTTHCYPRSMQKFSGDRSNEKLDRWVLDRVLTFFGKTREESAVREPGVIFFLHLLGIDTTGHATKPHSRQYFDNIRLVDLGVRRVEEAVERFYDNDGRTAYIYTSDHGMTDWGSHGAGLADETETPLVVWGAGLSGPKPVLLSGPNLDPTVHIESPGDWGMDKLLRRDVKQADLAALMSALLAIPTPTNSVGRVPRSLLAGSASWQSEAVLGNLRQLLLQLERARHLVHARLLPLFLRPFPQLHQLQLGQAETLMTAGQHDEAMLYMEQVFDLALEGIQYYQDYFSRGLKWAVTAAHLCWLAYLAKSLLAGQTIARRTSRVFLTALLVVMILTCTLVLMQGLPAQYVVYYALPCVLLWAVCKDCRVWWPSVASLLRGNLLRLTLLTIATLLAVALLVSSFFYRELLSAGLVVLALWPLAEQRSGNPVETRLCVCWFVCCLGLAAFPQLPVIGRQANYTLVLVSGAVVSVLGLVASWLVRGRSESDLLIPDSGTCPHACSRLDTVLLVSQSLVVATAALNVHLTAANFDAGLGLVWYNQGLSWSILLVSLVVPGCVSASVGPRLTSAWLSLASVLALLSVRHELVFLVLLLLAMSLYPAIELQLAAAPSQHASEALFKNYDETEVLAAEKPTTVAFGDLRRAYFYLFFTVLAFFGLGNVASVNSFDPAWVRCLVTTFSPHLMGVLILLKTAVPFLAVACGVCTAALLSQRPVQWLLVLGLSDAMALPFFHLVMTEGSWLDVGQSISHFVIAHACVLLLLLLHWAAHHWLSVSWACTKPPSPLPSVEAPSLLSKDKGE